MDSPKKLKIAGTGLGMLPECIKAGTVGGSRVYHIRFVAGEAADCETQPYDDCTLDLGLDSNGDVIEAQISGHHEVGEDFCHDVISRRVEVVPPRLFGGNPSKLLLALGRQ